eukprot:TRINITY_DN15801_c0_g1_i1.p1 TRINITY_DN15801_c0_g1~~TRINITY_DN15801_c0_g1_i1.p1  ORF type:complete len:138 (-),score=25.68 TRINITY_DN15801_c0_g1_i1:51-464(-)
MQARKASTKVPEVWINLGHICVAEENYDNAVTHYHKALELDKKQQPNVLLCLARAHFLNGKLNLCKDVLTKGLHRYPEWHDLRYNLALAQEEQAILILPKTYQTKDETQKIVENGQVRPDYKNVRNTNLEITTRNGK